MLASPRLALAPSGTGAAVITYPGIRTTDAALLPLRGFLRSKNHRPRGWGLGVNAGDPTDAIARSLPILQETFEESGRRVNLIGWSLGGVVARELARDHPELVGRIVTLGTPLHGPRFTASESRYADDYLATIDDMIKLRAQRPIRRPILSLFSPNDGVVDWRACVDRDNPAVTNTRVTSSHIGMLVDPAVWRRIAVFLAI